MTGCCSINDHSAGGPRVKVNMTTGTCIYKSLDGKANCLAVYEAALAAWPVPYEQLDLPTRFGSTHVLATGSRIAPPLVLLHGNWATAT